MRRLDFPAATLVENISLTARDAIAVSQIPQRQFFLLISAHDLFADKRFGRGRRTDYQLKDILHLRTLWELNSLIGTTHLRPVAHRLSQVYGSLIGSDGSLVLTVGETGVQLSEDTGLAVVAIVDGWQVFDRIWPAFRKIAADKLGERGLPNAIHALDQFDDFMRLARLRGEAA